MWTGVVQTGQNSNMTIDVKGRTEFILVCKSLFASVLDQ